MKEKQINSNSWDKLKLILSELWKILSSREAWRASLPISITMSYIFCSLILLFYCFTYNFGLNVFLYNFLGLNIATAIVYFLFKILIEVI